MIVSNDIKLSSGVDMKNSRASASAAMFVAVLALPLMAACSGGGGGSSPPPPPPPPPPVSSGPTWTSGVFEAASQFKDQCAAPRSGVDSEGTPFPDMAGSLLEENHWLRSWTNETYLWNTEVPDQNPTSFSDRLTYFAQLRTSATTASGEDKDDFHFSQPTAEYLEQRNSTPKSGYGVSFAVFSNAIPRDYRVQYTEPNSPASTVVSAQVNLARGTRILEVDGADLVNGNSQAAFDTLNNGLFPATAGEVHTFLVQDVGSASTRSITMTSADIAPQPVNRTSIINTGTGDVGYILFNTFSPFSSEQDIANAITSMKSAGINDLIVDLRYNGGGLLTVASQLGYMIAGPAQTNGKTFELLQFNAAAGNVNPVTGAVNQPISFTNIGVGFSLANGTPLDSLDLPRVFILSTPRTCSASEAVINGLSGVDVEVILIGSTTCGKPYGFYPTDNCGETFYSIQFQGVNDKSFGDYADGFVPNNSSFSFGVKLNGCAVGDDYSRELGDTNEALLAAALNYRATGTCPAPSATKPMADASYGTSNKTSVATTDLNPIEDVLANNRDMRTP